MTLSIEVRNLQFRYHDQMALDNVTFQLQGGKIYGLLGRNGSGKTTLLSLLASFRQPSAGQVLIDGEDPFENERLMPQVCLIGDSNLIPSGSRVRDVLALGASCRPTWDAAYAERLLQRFNLRQDQKVDTLSRGLRSVVGIVVGLASRAPVTLYDEAYLGLDAPTRYAFYDELLQDYSAHPRTIILSTHLIGEIANLLEEVVMIDQGRLVLHEETDVLHARGAAVIGPAAAVDRFVHGLQVLGEKRLGATKAATVYGELSPERQRRARAEGLELGPVELQDLFVYLTQKQGEVR